MPPVVPANPTKIISYPEKVFFFSGGSLFSFLQRTICYLPRNILRVSTACLKHKACQNLKQKSLCWRRRREELSPNELLHFFFCFSSLLLLFIPHQGWWTQSLNRKGSSDSQLASPLFLFSSSLTWRSRLAISWEEGEKCILLLPARINPTSFLLPPDWWFFCHPIYKDDGNSIHSILDNVLLCNAWEISAPFANVCFA